MPTYSKSLQVLKEEWQGCTKCDLGIRRKTVEGKFVFGEGKTGGIMFIGEGPGEQEEIEGRPFVGQSGKLLRKAIAKLGLTDYYISNVVTCRSCQQAYNGQGEPLTMYDRISRLRVPRMRDEPPFPVHVAACLPRLHEEIYLVDPVLIVTLGAEATKALTGKNISITSESGLPKEIEIPGAWRTPSLTEKRKAWGRKVGGAMALPTLQTSVKYLVIPTLHPAYVLRKHADKSQGNPFDVFIRDLKAAMAIYDRYRTEVFGIDAIDRELESSDFEVDYNE